MTNNINQSAANSSVSPEIQTTAEPSTSSPQTFGYTLPSGTTTSSSGTATQQMINVSSTFGTPSTLNSLVYTQPNSTALNSQSVNYFPSETSASILSKSSSVTHSNMNMNYPPSSVPFQNIPAPTPLHYPGSGSSDVPFYSVSNYPQMFSSQSPVSSQYLSVQHTLSTNTQATAQPNVFSPSSITMTPNVQHVPVHPTNNISSYFAGVESGAVGISTGPSVFTSGIPMSTSQNEFVPLSRGKIRIF